MDKIDSQTLPVDALNERRRRAVKMRLDGTSLKDSKRGLKAALLDRPSISRI